MVAAVRGGSPRRAAPRIQASAKRGARGKAPGYAPAKLSAAGRVGLAPTAALVLAAMLMLAIGLVAASHNARVRAMTDSASARLHRLFLAAGFKVQTLTVQGASPVATADIARASGIYRGQPILDIDLEALRQRIEQVGWVDKARIERLLPDTLVIAVTERKTLAIWQHDGRSLVIDSTGRPMPEADPARFADLPVVVGDGAQAAAPQILPLLAAHPALRQRLAGLVRIDDRRWDLRVKDGGVIELPAEDETGALARLDTLNAKSRILELGFERIDLRDPDLVAVRPRQAPPAGPLVANGD